MNRETEVLTLVRDLARLMTHIRPSSLVPTNVEQSKNSSKWHEAVREIEATAHHMLAKDEEPEEGLALHSYTPATTIAEPVLAQAIKQLSKVTNDSGGES